MNSNHISPHEEIPIFSFASAELGPISNAFIRGLERFTGQPRIKRIYTNYINDGRPRALFWQDAVVRLNLTVNLTVETGVVIPKTGPLLVIANHPFGVIDGLILCAEISKIRSDYKIITHRVLREAPVIKDQILPIDFDETEAALQTNMQTRKDAVAQIENGGALILFPAGAISLAHNVFGNAEDSAWKFFVAKLSCIKGTTTLPVFFSGQNSSVYMLARRISLTLGYSLMFREIRRRIGKTIDVTIRKPITADDLKCFDSRVDITRHLRDITYGSD